MGVLDDEYSNTRAKQAMATAAKKVAGAAAPTIKTGTSAASKVKVTPAPAKSKVSPASVAKKVAGAAKPSIRSGSGGSSPAKRVVKTTTVRSSGMDPVGDGPSLGMLYDFMESPERRAPAMDGVGVAPSYAMLQKYLPEVLNKTAPSRLTGTRADAPGDVYPSFAEYLDAVSPSFNYRPEGGLNSDAYYRRAAEAGGKPFEGVVDWGGIASALGFGGQPTIDYRPNPISITVSGGSPAVSWADARNRAMTPDRLAPGVSTAGKTLPPTVLTGTPADTSIDRAYSMEAGYSEPLQAIEAVAPAVTGIDLPRRDPRGYASTSTDPLFMTDGQVTLPDGSVITPGAPAAGIDAAAAPKEPTMWDNVVDNTGKLLGHTALGGVVSTLFPDMWDGIGDAFKGNGAPGTRDLNAERERSNARAQERFRNSQQSDDGWDGRFPDLNHNGIDDRIEGYTGPDTALPPANPAVPVWDLPPIRQASFPMMPPYNPGRSDEWSYFTNNHLADGGVVHAYADGGSIDMADPRVAVIGAAEDALERIKSGEKPGPDDERALRAFVAEFGDGALKQLYANVGEGMSMASGRLIRGPGGPKEDAVPAVIVEEGSVVSPAKLSNGEFVFSVDAVEGAGGPEALQELSDRLVARKGAA